MRESHSSRHVSHIVTWVGLAAAAAAAGCGPDPSYGNDLPVTPVGPEQMGLHVVGNHIENANGETVRIRGVNRSGTEYQCVHGGQIFDGAWNLASISAIASWNANAVRIPLNESCWLGLNGAPAATSGQTYRDDIKLFVSEVQRFHIIPIVELHWVGPGDTLATQQQPMPDADHAIDFWTSVAQTFADNSGVVFELYNEPFPDSNRESNAAWDCWANGCMANQAGTTDSTYQAVGMNAIVAAVRPIASNLILLGGIRYSNSLEQWSARVAPDPGANLGAAWHVYNFNYDAACDLDCLESSWNGAPAALAAAVPIVATEIGEATCAGGFISPLMDWLDGHGAHYLAWSWNSYGPCVPPTPPARQGGKPWALITDYSTGTPNGGYAQTFHDHLQVVTMASR